MRESYGSDAVRPRVFDPDDPEAVRAASEPVAAPEPPPAPESRRRRPWIGRGFAALVAVVALGVGVFSGLRWQQHRDSVRTDRAVALDVRVNGMDSQTGIGAVTIDTSVDNRGPKPVTLLGLTLSAGKLHGTSSELVLGNTSPTDVGVPVDIPCTAKLPGTMGAKIRVRSADGHVTTIERSINTDNVVGAQFCGQDGSATPNGTIASYRLTAAGADVSVRLALDPDGLSAPNVAVVAPPLTPENDKLSGLTLKSGSATTVVVHLDVAGACKQGLSSTGLPGALTVSTNDAQGETNETTVALPLPLVASLAGRIQSECHGAALP